MTPKVSVHIDGTMVLIGLVLVGGAVLYFKRKAVVDAVNPLSDQNVAYKAANAAIGEQNFATIGDYYFGALSLLNPFASDTAKNYAKQVYGISQ